MQNQKKVQKCADALKSMLPRRFAPTIGIVLGTGLGNLSACLSSVVEIPYAELPGFPESTVRSHQGSFAAGYWGGGAFADGTGTGIPVLMQQGRCHIYEGRSPKEVCMGVRVMALRGIRALIVTNAAGAINPRYDVGGLMLIEDHINFIGQSPLTGPNEDEWGPRFPDMSRAYDPEMGRILEKAALRLGVRLEKGVYACVPGPQLETRAETRFLRMAGADAVGMSTALEVIAARHMGVHVAGISILTNKNLPDCMAGHTIEQIIEEAEKAEATLEALLRAAMPELGESLG
jgi:purine-nucleoside phosphorylase